MQSMHLMLLLMFKSIEWSKDPPPYTVHAETLVIFSLSRTTGSDVHEGMNVRLSNRLTPREGRVYGCCSHSLHLSPADYPE